MVWRPGFICISHQSPWLARYPWRGWPCGAKALSFTFIWKTALVASPNIIGYTTSSWWDQSTTRMTWKLFELKGDKRDHPERPLWSICSNLEPYWFSLLSSVAVTLAVYHYVLKTATAAEAIHLVSAPASWLTVRICRTKWPQHAERVAVSTSGKSTMKSKSSYWPPFW